MAMSAVERHHLKKLVKELESHLGRHTELVSVYIPAGYDINKVVAQLSSEQGTATNIKSSATRKNVIDSLERMIQHLRLFNKTPTNGLAVFSGNVAEREGQQDLQVWSVEPPNPLKTRIYRCDKRFVTEPLRDMTETKEIYGLVVMDRREGTIALLKGKSIIPVARSTSNVPGKTRAGGQSAQRFERLREGAAKDFYNRLGEHMKDSFFDMRENLKGILVGGPGPTKNDFVEGNFITNELKQKIITIKDLSYTDDFGLQELVDKSQDVLASEEIAGEKKLVGKFLQSLATNSKMVEYGKAPVLKALELGAIDVLLLSESLDDKELEELEEKAKELGTETQIISTETREGAQLAEMGGIGALLRYELS